MEHELFFLIGYKTPHCTRMRVYTLLEKNLRVKHRARGVILKIEPSLAARIPGKRTNLAGAGTWSSLKHQNTEILLSDDHV